MSALEDWAENDYEPTPDEISDTFSWFQTAARGDHGNMVFVASMERYIWGVENIFWGHREVLDDGRIQFSWSYPAHHCEEE